MTAFEPPALDMSHVSEVLEAAHAILEHTHDADLGRKIVTLSRYLALNRVYPSRIYEQKVRESLAKLSAAIHCYCKNQTEAPSN